MNQSSTSSDPRVEWINTVKHMHKNKRYAGYVGCALGAAMILAARFVPDRVPDWMFAAGIMVIAASWLTFVFVLVAKWLWVKKNPYKP